MSDMSERVLRKSVPPGAMRVVARIHAVVLYAAARRRGAARVVALRRHARQSSLFIFI